MARKKRLTFDIDLPEDEPLETKAAAPAEAPAETPRPAGASARRGPMASAIGENADAVRERRAAEAAIREENDRLAHELVRLKRLGLVTDLVPIERIRAEKLTRDRRTGADEALEELKRSLQETGLSNPIRVQEDGSGGYELIQGWRRLSAYRALLEETGDDRWAAIPAGLTPKDMTVEGLYRRMVDENLVRKDVSFAEMATLAKSYAEDASTGAADLDEAVRTLFASADYQKRSYIRAFAALIDRIGAHLSFPEAISRNLGLALRKRAEASEAAAEALATALDALGPDRTAEDELAVLRRFAEAEAAPKAPKPAAGRPARAKRTAFDVARPGGEAKCVVSEGRFELKGPEDFAAYDRKRLRKAVAAFYKALDG
ncbi:MAG: ParB N-terminal domain-containing protein [Pseudomonadota bacterium]